MDPQQNASESVSEFLTELKTIARLAYPTNDAGSRDTVIKPIFRWGLLPNIKEGLQFRSLMQLNDIINAAKEIEAELQQDEQCKVEVRILEDGCFKSSLSFGAPGREFFTWRENQVIKGPQISGVTEEKGHSKGGRTVGTALIRSTIAFSPETSKLLDHDFLQHLRLVMTSLQWPDSSIQRSSVFRLL